MNQTPFDPKEMIAPVAAGFVAGIAIMALLVGIALALNLSMSIQFGIPSH